MISNYFEDWEVKPEYTKELVSLWKGWLGQDNHHKLDEVTKKQWSRFNQFLRRIAEDFSLELVNCENQSLKKINDIEDVLSNYRASMSKESSEFIKLIVSDLECVISKEWDYTYIIWHKTTVLWKPLFRIYMLQVWSTFMTKHITRKDRVCLGAEHTNAKSCFGY